MCAYVRAREREGLHVFLQFSFPFFSISSHRLENPPVSLPKTTRHFMKNDTLFYGKQAVIL